MFLKIIALLVIIAIISFIFLRKPKKTEPEYQSITFENKFKVTEIIDGNTFRISPGWKWNDKKGNTIRPMGYDTPEKGSPGYQKTKEKLEQLLLDKEVELKNPIKLSYNRLLCDVFIDNHNLKDFFPEYLVKEENLEERNA